MPENVVPFLKGDKEFPDWFPKGSYLEVAFAVGRAVPDKAGEVHYDYMLKPIIGMHLPCSIILQVGGNVLFNNLDHFGDNARLQNWIKVNKEALRQISMGRKKPLTLVGKVISNVFYLYYVIEDEIIYFDAPSMAARIWGSASLLGDSLVIVPVGHSDATLIINRSRGTVAMSRLDFVEQGQHVLGAPVTIEKRDDAIGSPRLFTTPERMRFFSFTHQGG